MATNQLFQVAARCAPGTAAQLGKRGLQGLVVDHEQRFEGGAIIGSKSADHPSPLPLVDRPLRRAREAPERPQCGSSKRSRTRVLTAALIRSAGSVRASAKIAIEDCATRKASGPQEVMTR